MYKPLRSAPLVNTDNNSISMQSIFSPSAVQRCVCVCDKIKILTH